MKEDPPSSWPITATWAADPHRRIAKAGSTDSDKVSAAMKDLKVEPRSVRRRCAPRTSRRTGRSSGKDDQGPKTTGSPS